MTTNPRISEGLLDMLFGIEQCKYDLVGGVISGVTDRVIYLTTDLIRGIYHALNYEAGEAWTIIFKNCGYIWGKREIGRLNKEIQVRMRKGLAELSVGEFLELIENYFSRQGWGKLQINLDDAEQYGIVRASLHNGLFDEALGDLCPESVNSMITGILRAFFEFVSQAELDCLEVSWSRGDKPLAEFLISGNSRIGNLQEKLDNQPTAIHQALGMLRAA